jgi:hypothetical protein
MLQQPASRDLEPSRLADSLLISNLIDGEAAVHFRIDEHRGFA